MKKETKILVIIFSLSLLLGLMATVLWRNPIQNTSGNLVSRQTTALLNNEKALLYKQEKTLADLNEEYTKIQKEFEVEESILSKEEAARYRNLKMFLGEYDLIGEGIIIKLESVDDNHNLAFEFDSDRTLLKIINFAKYMGAESIAINNQFISNYSGIVLAGNHININDIPVTPPYEIKILGNEKKLYRYFSEESVFMMVLEKNNNLKITMEKSKKITVPKIKAFAKLEYLQEKK